MTVKDLPTLRTDIAAAIPDNVSEDIGAGDVRDTGFIDTIDSLEKDSVTGQILATGGSVPINNAVGLTQSEYDAINTKNPNTLYVII